MKNKMQMQTPSLADRNFATLFALFPNAVTETITGYEDILDENGEPIKDTDGNVKQRAIIERTVDPDVLQQEINTHVLQENLKKICNEIFGESNCVGIGQLRRVEGKPGKSKDMGRTSEFVIIYAKEKDRFTIGTLPVSEAGLKEFRYEDEKGRFRRGQIYYPNRGIHNYTVNTPYGNSITGDFTVQKEVFDNYNSENKIYWAEQGEHTPYLKIYLSEYEGTTPTNTFGKEFGSSQGAVKALFEMNEMLFDNPKPTKFLNKLLLIGNVSNNDIILDFFSGSATTAHAVMQLNAHEAEAAHRSGNRKFILVQIPELCKEDSEAFKAGYKNICEIGKERIRRAGAKIKEQNLLITTELDIGFRVLKLDTSNMEDVYYTPDKIAQMILQGETEKLLENIKKDRSTNEVFGNYIDIYDMTQAVEDGATRPVFYEKCVVKEWDGVVPKDCERLLIKGDYVVTERDAELIAKSGVKLLGVESQSVGDLEKPMPVHLILLGVGVILLEGLVLSGVENGEYTLSAFSLNLGKCDSSLVRAVLMEE